MGCEARRRENRSLRSPRRLQRPLQRLSPLPNLTGLPGPSGKPQCPPPCPPPQLWSMSACPPLPRDLRRARPWGSQRRFNSPTPKAPPPAAVFSHMGMHPPPAPGDQPPAPPHPLSCCAQATVWDAALWATQGQQAPPPCMTAAVLGSHLGSFGVSSGDEEALGLEPGFRHAESVV